MAEFNPGATEQITSIMRVISFIKFNSVCLLLACSTLSLLLADDKPSTVGDTAPDFRLQTADGKTHQLKKLRGSVVLLIVGNRKLRKDDNRWARAVMANFKGRASLCSYILSDMRNIPKFISRDFIKKQLLKKPPPVPLLLDWEGKVHQLYGAECNKRKKPVLYLINQQGKIVFHQYARFDPKLYQKIRQIINDLLPHP